MGRYKDYHREPRRDGFVTDQGFDAPVFKSRSVPKSTIATQATEPVDAIVKWFNADKGFGFVELVSGSEAFMHMRQVEAAGHRSVPEGARVKVRIEQGQKGPEVSQIVEVLLGSVVAGSSAGRARAIPSQVTSLVRKSTGTVKVYKADKGFGFVRQDGGEKDGFVHATTLARVGLSRLVEGQRVRMRIGQSQKGLEAQDIELLD